MASKSEEIEIKLLLEAIYLRYHYDFRGYAPSSLGRSLARAKEHFRCRTYSALQEKVLHEPEILPQIISLMTVQVSEFFRDAAYFRAIRERVVPYLKTYSSLKVWVAGCGTGEEVYSFAILFREEGLESRTLFYGTDINVEALSKAEQGAYSADLTPRFAESYRLSGGKAELSNYYTTANRTIVLDKSLRQRIVFTDHSLVTDSVFAEVQFVSCRNVLIYFGRELQDRATELFKDALSRKGFLGLGSRESLRTTQFGGAFSELAGSDRIYQKKEEN